jgi:hypothetical protein
MKNLQVSKVSIAKIVEVFRTAPKHFIGTRKLNPTASQRGFRVCTPKS